MVMILKDNPGYNRHPCFNDAVKGQYGRVHLPVAPRCNIQCNYCNRKYDCVNESRPGVTSTVLEPSQTIEYMARVLAAEPRISVAGIAGPGDPFADPDKTMATLRGLRRHYPQLLLCLSSNGLAMPPYVEEIADIGVSHVTLTVNGIDPEITKKIYAWVRDGKVIYRERQAAELLLARQLEAIRRLKASQVIIKVNYIVIPGINDHHAAEAASFLANEGVDLFNCMPLLPNADTPFANYSEPNPDLIKKLRSQCEVFLPQMRHCQRCRADAVGLLHEDRSSEMAGCLKKCAAKPISPGAEKPYVAVSSWEGMLVNQHLGEAIRFLVFRPEGEGFVLVEERRAPKPGGGAARWQAVAGILSDCRALLVSDMGDTPRRFLQEAGIKPVLMSGLIEHGLRAIYNGKGLDALKKRTRSACALGSCQGDGTGCG